MKPDLAALQKLLPDLDLAAGCIVPAGEHHRAAAFQALDHLCSGTGPTWLWTAESPHILHRAAGDRLPGGAEVVGDRPLVDHYPLAGEQGPAEPGGTSLRLCQTGLGWTLWEQARVDGDAGVIVTWRYAGQGSPSLLYEVGFAIQPSGALQELRPAEYRFLGFAK